MIKTSSFTFLVDFQSQVWAYESIPGIAQRGFAEKVECEAHPRILHWKSRGVLTHKVVVDHILQCDGVSIDDLTIIWFLHMFRL